jgi:hypothetical protein
MFTLYDVMPFTVLDPILTVKIHISNHRGHCLHTAAVVEPQKEGGEQKQDYDARNLKV